MNHHRSSKMTKWYYYWTERQRRCPRRHRTLSSSSVPGKTSRFFSSRLCMIAVSLAFMGGFVVGILLPICAPPTVLATSSSPDLRSSSVPAPLLATNSSPQLRTPSGSAASILVSNSSPDLRTPSVSSSSSSSAAAAAESAPTSPNDTQLLTWRDEHLAAVQRSNDLLNDPKMDEETPRGELSMFKPGFVSDLNLEGTSLQRKNEEEKGGGRTTTTTTTTKTTKIHQEEKFSRKNYEIETNSSFSSDDGGVLLRMLLRTLSPPGPVTSSRREVQIEKRITHRTRPVLFFDSTVATAAAAVTAGWPQITRPYPPPPPPLHASSTPHLRLHHGVQTTISTPRRMQNNNNNKTGSSEKSAVVDPSLLNGKTTVVQNLATLQEQQSEVSEPQNVDPKSLGTVRKLVDGVYWSDTVEAMLPIGFKQQDVAAWTEFSSNATVVKVVEGCGRMQNRLLIFDNGTKSCCRYRQNNDQIQGEIFSFYLSKLLDLRNLPPASLGLLYGRERQWTPVRGQLTLAQWNEQKPVVMTKFVDNLEVAFIPRHFRGDDGPSKLRRLHPIGEDLDGLGLEKIVELAQWSDLIIFDYLTANLDRVVNNMYNKQWNPDMMAAPAHNLAKETESGLLVFLDNESGLLHGYRLLDKYESYHKAMLESLCIFRRSTSEAVRRLLENGGDIGQKLKNALHEAQPSMAEWLPPLPDKSVKILRQRLDKVNQQIAQCEQRYSQPHHSSSSTSSRTVSDGNVVVSAMERYDIPVTPFILSN